MINFDDWVRLRQDARQWSEDEKACAEIAWKEAIKLFKGDSNAGTSTCPKCRMVCFNNGFCYRCSGVA
jgi:hypothetical protein